VRLLRHPAIPSLVRPEGREVARASVAPPSINTPSEIGIDDAERVVRRQTNTRFLQTPLIFPIIDISYRLPLYGHDLGNIRVMAVTRTLEGG